MSNWAETAKRLQNEDNYKSIIRTNPSVEKIELQTDKSSTILSLYININNNLNSMLNNISKDKDTLLEVRKMIDEEMLKLNTHIITIE